MRVLVTCLLLPLWLNWATAGKWDSFSFGAELPQGLHVHDYAHITGFLDLAVFTGYRDLCADGWGEEAELSVVKAHVDQNPMLWQKVCTRLILPPSSSTHEHKFFILAPPFP